MRFCLKENFNEASGFRMNNVMKKRIILSVVCMLALGACEKTKDNLGLNKQAPDEFRVVKRAPLDLPPDYSLRPPRPGASRPQEATTSQAAAQAVFGDTAASEPAAPTSGEAALLGRAGSAEADPSIRRVVDSETSALFDRNKPVAEKIFGFGGDKNESSATVVDAKAEQERLEGNAAEGKPVTEGDTPSIEQ